MLSLKFSTNFKSRFWFFLIFLSFFKTELCSIDFYEAKKKHFFSICSVFKNEERFLKEWIEYHQLVGVDHFYLYRVPCKDKSLDLLTPYIKNGIVTVINWYDLDVGENEEAHRSIALEVPAYHHAIKYKAVNETKWIAILEVNEFLVPLGNRKISEILKNYEECPGIVLESDYFDASAPVFPPKQLLIQTIALSDDATGKGKNFEKTIFKPDLVESFSLPSCRCNFKDNKSSVKTSRNEIRVNRYEKRSYNDLFLGKRKTKVKLDSRNYSEKEIKELCRFNFEVDDSERAIYQYIPKMLEKIGGNE